MQDAASVPQVLGLLQDRQAAHALVRMESLTPEELADLLSTVSVLRTFWSFWRVGVDVRNHLFLKKLARS